MRGPLVKPLRTPDMLRKRQQQQQQQQGRALSLKQQIEQQHQQQLVPWSSSQPISASAARSLSATPGNTSSSSSSSGSRPSFGGQSTSPSSPNEGPSSDYVPFEQVAQQVLQRGDGARRLRFSVSRQSRSLLVAKLPETIKTLRQPISITRDIPLLPDTAEAHAVATAAAAAPWRLRDSSDVQQLPDQQQQQHSEKQQQQQQQHEQQEQQQGAAGSSAPPIPMRRPQQKTFVTRKNEVDASCFFLLVESQGVLDVLPVSEWLTFERTLGTQQPSPEELESRSKAQASLDAALTRKAVGLRRASDSEDDTRKNKMANAQQSLFDDELGLERQKKKRLKSFLKDKNNSKGKTNEYIDSALSLGNLRQEAVTWDFEEGERSDDEGGEAPQDAKENAAETLEADPVESETDDDPEDPLTSFGQKMKNLLEKARDEEADAELHQYESDDDEEEGADEKAQDGQSGGPSSSGGPPSDVGQRAGGAPSRSTQGGPQQQTEASGCAQQQEVQETLEAKVVRVMQQHMGRMAVKDFMTVFKVKEKNEDFKRIQAVVHKVCKMEATEDKQKFIVLKPEFRL
ncbi:hypothetical protein, conserved [Eimeria tenella]|uniref:Transcription initiation factor IIF subunit alpha n=1 Tax=Eimeria tenella TaxID=5802 RepID=U6KP57_EIMTE|nr:hypothetical protein, conserved [Eimeria tenella]CDJ39892.1 hypothetical protein, conserved [Eimeria tenella]|eukprot:XP_013230645.1 hypothetical protein, conserved [Eimeria tenella]